MTPKNRKRGRRNGTGRDGGQSANQSVSRRTAGAALSSAPEQPPLGPLLTKEGKQGWSPTGASAPAVRAQEGSALQPVAGFDPQIETEIAGVKFQNPVWTASGTFGYGREFAHLIDLNQLGAIVVKGISPEPMEGNPPPRIYETESGMLNAIGLQNVGAKRFLAEKLPFLRTLRARCIVNVFAYSTEDYVRCIETLNAGEGIAAYELNISCPNTRCGGIVYGSDPKLTEEVVAAAKQAARFPLFVKLSPNVTDITVFARAAEAAGADALSLVNTFVGMSIDIETRTPRLSNVTGGLSGPAIKPVALRMVYQAARAVKIPIIGLGGIAGTEDALEYFIAGARAIQVGTANFYDPSTSIRIVQGLRDYCQRKQLRLADLIGSLKIPYVVTSRATGY